MALNVERAATAIAVTIALSLAACPAAAYTVYVSNEKGNSITVLDSATFEVLETIPVGQRPRGIMLTKDGKHLLPPMGYPYYVRMTGADLDAIIAYLRTVPAKE